MKKIILAAILAGAALSLSGCKNDNAAETVVMDVNGVTVQNLSSENDRELAEKIDLQNRISVQLEELEKVNSAEVNIADGSVTAVLDISGELSQTETEGIVSLIKTSVDGVSEENIVITDQNNNVIFSV
ncbi:MAG: hypothetical protein NC253_05735 [Ruminococcus sp.]|nr:hypothetical protein [Ruminococcus sp.]MCM1380698.1 hypothetical protein [Muribaculaceae bacterium]